MNNRHNIIHPSFSMDNLVLPRPGATSDSHASKSPISGPTEAAFTKTFGTLLPPAKYLELINAKAAYYEFSPPSSAKSPSSSHAIERVLFIHGVQTPALGMLPLARTLRTRFPQAHLVLVDLWGHGLSDTPVAPHEPKLFHGLIDSLLDHLSWPSAHLVGYSFGGALTVGYVASRPSRVQSFTLVAPAGLIRSSDYSSEELAYLHGEDQAAARKWVLNFLEGGELVVPADWEERVGKGEVVAEAVREWQMREHAGHVASVVAVVRDGGVMDNDATFLQAVQTKIPSLVVLGELDGVCNEKELKGLGFGSVVVVPRVGHAVVRERHSEVADSIRDFWTNFIDTSGN
ncbi:Alpha/Beta hydrolase protein [Dendryphion nanum]|uniref:Alpha/Beta hydrolase protein n=1 Tax=Dendryphion nanum TaxID=256645 RepID=A0A9P9D1D6_9PLEO|nr:Alpha/Beta hydrolase protein [Dendryphion nanum]